MSIVLPKEILYSNQLPSLPPDTINTSIVLAPVNGATFSDSAQIQFDLPSSGFLDPNTLYLRYKNNYTQTATTTGYIRGTPAVAPFFKLEVFFGTQIVETISSYNMIYNMVTNLQMNVAQKMGCPNYAYLDDASAPSTSNQNGGVVGAGSTSDTYALPLMCILSSCQNLVPLFAMPNIRLQLTIDTASNIFYNTSTNTTAQSLSNVELCFDQIDFGYGVEQMVRGMGEKIFLKSHSWASMTQTLPTFIGTTELVYNARYASIKSLFANFAGNDATKGINKNFDSYDVTQTGGVKNGDYQFIISGKGYPTRPISTTNNKCGALMELKQAINGGLHSLQAQNMLLMHWNGM